MIDWKTCKNKRLAKSISADEPLIASLIKSSDKKAKTASIIEINDLTASSILSLQYEAARELLEALAIKNGYKIYNHECYGAFLGEVLGESSYAELFDRLRKIRNKVNYYGSEVNAVEILPIIKDIKRLTSGCRRLLKT